MALSGTGYKLTVIVLLHVQICSMLSNGVPMYRNNIKLRSLYKLFKKVPNVGIHKVLLSLHFTLTIGKDHIVFVNFVAIWISSLASKFCSME